MFSILLALQHPGIRVLAYEAILGTPLSGRLVKPEVLVIDALFGRDAVLAPHYHSLTATLCPDGTCRTRHGDAPIYFDRDHFTVDGAMAALSGLKP